MILYAVGNQGKKHIEMAGKKKHLFTEAILL